MLAPFAYRSPSRFSDGYFGVLYTAETRDAALRDVLSKLSRTYLDGPAHAQETRKRHFTLRLVAGDLVDVCRARVRHASAAFYDRANYAAAQKFGAEIRERHPGLSYDSVRHRGGVCVGAFVPRIVSDVRLQSILAMVWDGSQFIEQKDIRSL